MCFTGGHGNEQNQWLRAAPAEKRRLSRLMTLVSIETRNGLRIRGAMGFAFNRFGRIPRLMTPGFERCGSETGFFIWRD
jgi:hypothetical protein